MFGFILRPRKTNSAQTAKERLQILLAHERSSSSSPDYLPQLQQDILEVVKKYIKINGDGVEVKLDRDGEFSSLEINIEIPSAEKPTVDA